ncbi:hypothetical protein ACSAZK_06570 [Methanosarcina sp. Mfa9]|uniref:hypothetical protein n=1 Tax=Methanosarcina sp. Mfa9 TaxID=3439063 RepID=UPI003F86C4FC
MMVLSRAAYPERFSGIKLDEWFLDFCINVYGVDEALRSGSCRLGGWTGVLNDGFVEASCLFFIGGDCR